MVALSVSIAEMSDSLTRRAQGGRIVVALAGPPGGGKSTFAEALSKHLYAHDVPSRVVPMDGLHLDDAILDEQGLRSRKGAPHTFDVLGLKTLLERIKNTTDRDVYFPVFDRTLELSRAAAGRVRATDRVVIIEGNYLLLDEPGWSDIADMFDYSIMLSVPETELRRRLDGRWRGLGLDMEATRAKVEDNDLINAQLVVARSRIADLTIETWIP